MLFLWMGAWDLDVEKESEVTKKTRVTEESEKSE